MKTRIARTAHFLSIAFFSVLNFGPLVSLRAAPLGTAFTYQGTLAAGGKGASGIYDLRLTLYDAASGPAQVGGALTNAAVAVSNGLFTVSVNFGSGVFAGDARWLEIAVRTNGGGAFTTLTPRQPLTPSPYALYAPSAGMAGSATSATSAGAVGVNGVANGSLQADAVTSDKIADGTIAAGDLNAASFNATFWRATGNAGTTPGTHFLGTTDNQPLELKVNGERVLKFAPGSSNSVNIAAGWGGNTVSPGVVGGTIAGGGAGLYYGSAPSNRVESDFGSIGGGGNNVIQDGADGATIGGGVGGLIEAEARRATISGGGGNLVRNTARYSTIGGGQQNRIDTNSSLATISGGALNLIDNNAPYAAVGGGSRNNIADNAEAGTIGGGYWNDLAANAAYATVAGGYNNLASGVSSFIGGGANNEASNNDAVVVGGLNNTATYRAAVVGGEENVASGAYAMIGGGWANIASGTSATIPGGEENAAASLAFAAGHRAKANHKGTFVWADSQDADFASTANNQFNIRASGGLRVSDDTPAVSFGSTARQMINLWSTSYAIGIQSGTVYQRTAGRFSWFKGGTHSNTQNDPGTGGSVLMTLTSSGLYVNNTFVSTSDRNAKEEFEPVDPNEVLGKVLDLPLSRWTYKSDEERSRHLGPMAQDFRAAFGLGPDDKHIATVDADGVALAAIQGLNQKVEVGQHESAARIQKLEAENAELRARLDRMERLFTNPSNNQ